MNDNDAVASDNSSAARDGMTVWPWRKRKAAEMTMEIIDWMRDYTIVDLRELAVATEKDGGDADSLKRLLTDLEYMQRDIATWDSSANVYPYQLGMEEGGRHVLPYHDTEAKLVESY